MRLRLTAAALAELGPVDLFVVTNPGVEADVPGAVDAARVGRSTRTRPSVPIQALRWATHRAPAHVARFDLRRAADDLAAWVAPAYDVVWLFKPEAWVIARRAGVATARAVCDIDDLDDERLRTVAALARAETPAPEMTGPLGAVRRAIEAVDQRRWRRLHRQVADGVATVAFCSEHECKRSGIPAGAVVPNGYVAPTTEADHDDAPVMALAGSFSYLPNLDGARWFIDRVLPRVRAQRPDAELRLVGSPRHPALSGPGVTWAGPVHDAAAEVSAASIAVAPLRAGAGTPIKVLEAWACGTPVVATSFAVQGLDVAAGEDVLVADTADAFADACVALLDDHERSTRIADAGRARWRAHHAPDVIRAAVLRLAAGGDGLDERPAGNVASESEQAGEGRGDVGR